MILKEGGTVRGLTTAAGIWAVAAVGMAVATDRYLRGPASPLLKPVGRELIASIQSALLSCTKKR
jgi:uncharacterized membrane protein YhiD involved in acid resistance